MDRIQLTPLRNNQQITVQFVICNQSKLQQKTSDYCHFKLAKNTYGIKKILCQNLGFNHQSWVLLCIKVLSYMLLTVLCGMLNHFVTIDCLIGFKDQYFVRQLHT